MIKAVVFDLDGVLVDTAEWHFQALNQALGTFQYEITRQEYGALYLGLTTAAKLDLLSQNKQFPKSLKSFVHGMKQVYTQQLIRGACAPNPKVISLLQSFKAQGLTLAITSNSIRATVDLIVERAGLREYFDVILSNEEVTRPKPAPEIYQKVFEFLKLSPNEIVVLESFPPGIQAARQVCPNVIVISNAGDMNLERLQKKIATFQQKTDSHSSAPQDLQKE